MEIQTNFINAAIKQFRYYKQLGDRCFNQLSEEDQIFWSPNESNNSIAVIVQHMSGNMLSRWTNFLTEDGEKAWRNRDGEFECSISSKTEMITIWEEGWHCLFLALESIDKNNLSQTVYIRNMGHTVIEAVQRQLCHYAYHVGQIVYLAKILVEDFKSLSIPKAGSEAYNEMKFSKAKRREHFTDDLIDGDKEQV